MSKQERVAELKQEFERYVRHFSMRESNINVLFREWVFEKLAVIPTPPPKTVQEALARCRKWGLSDEEVETLLK